MSFPIIPLATLPLLTRNDMIEVDRLMMEEYHIGLVQMMENAGRGLARLAISYWQKHPTQDKQVLVLAGSGGNGGGALVAARRLAGWGIPTQVLLSTSPENLGEVPKQQFRILQAMGVPMLQDWPADSPGLILDGMIGYSLSGAPRGKALNFIQKANHQTQAPVLAIDTPSGLDVTHGHTQGDAIRATATLTLALPKTGLTTRDAKEYTGDLFLTDISVPHELYQRLPIAALPIGLFSQGDVVQLQ